MKKVLYVALAVGSVVAQAASNVTLYGRMDVGYEKDTGLSLAQTSNSMSRLGIKGEEDLGHGLTAIFQLEGGFDADTGAKTAGLAFFDRESTVGLKGEFGQIRFGRTRSALNTASTNFQLGERTANRLYEFNSDFVYGNGLFYDYAHGPFSFGASVSTKGGYNQNSAGGVDNEGRNGSQASYGAYANYLSGNAEVSLGYQADRNGAMKNEWFLGASYAFSPVVLGASYAKGKHTSGNKLDTWQAFVIANITANDMAFVKYMHATDKTASGIKVARQDMFGAGYTHMLSKRTSIYADVGHYRNRLTGQSHTGYDISMRHVF